MYTLHYSEWQTQGTLWYSEKRVVFISAELAAVIETNNGQPDPKRNVNFSKYCLKFVAKNNTFLLFINKRK